VLIVKRRLSLLAALVFAGLFAGFLSISQAQVTGTISGNVLDPSGAMVPGSTITATLVQQNLVRTAESSADGHYIFNALPPGEYTLTAEQPGFQRLVRSNIALAVNQNLRVDLTMQIGEVSEVVEVTASAPLVDTRSGAISSLVDDRRVVDLPLNGRNVISLAGTLPGIVSVKAPQQLSDARSGPTMNVNGSLETMNLFTFNGGMFINPSRNTGMNYPPPDALQEFSIQTQNFSAEYGRNAGSQVNVVSKSGTNELHGAAWEFLRNDVLNARNFFASRRPAQVQNQFGFAVGGPVKKDTVFLFGSYQGLRDRREAVSSTINVPSAAERNGDFRDLGTSLKNPVDALTGQSFTDSAGNPCIVENVVSPSCISPVAKNLLPFIPDTGGSFTLIDPQPRNGDMTMIRGDWNQSSNHVVSGHFFLDKNKLSRPQLASGNIPGYLGSFTDQQTTMGTLNDTYTFSPTLLNQATVTFLRSFSNANADNTVTHDQIGVNMPFYPEFGRLSVSIGNISLGSRSRFLAVSNNWQFRNQTSWVTGKHNFKFGGEWMHLTFLQIFLGSSGMQFNGSRSGDEVADFLLGAFNRVNGGFGVRTNDNIQDAPSLFFQDDFKVHPRLTLSFGLRWEPLFPWVDKYDRLTSLAQVGTPVRSQRFPDAPPGVLFAGDPGVPRTISPSDLNNIAPRFGFAWDIFGDGRMSIRGSYGVFYDSIKADSVSQEGAPWAGNFQVFNGRAENPFGSLGLVPPPVVPAGEGFGCVDIPSFPGVQCDRFPVPISGVFIDSNVKTPYVQSWNLTLQRQLTSDLMVQASYLGKAAIKLDGWRDFNPAIYVNDPITGAAPSLQNVNNRVIIAPGILAPNVIQLESSFRSWYHSFQGQVIKRFSHGMSFSAAYTLSKSIDMLSSNIFNRGLDNPLDGRANRGRSDFDRRHALVMSWLWSPTWKFDHSWQNGLFSGWTFTGIHTLQSGSPFTVRMGDDVAQDGSGSRQHALLVPGAQVERDHSSRGDMIAEFFNTDAFVPTNQVPRGVYGDSGRNIISGPGFANTDFSAMKDFRVTERARVQFRSEFFNIFNQVALGCRETTGGCSDPDNNASSRTFGRIRSAGAAREIQFAIKLIW
jgi:hypothetical protein